MTLLQNTLEGGTNATTITTGNSGGASGNAFHAIVGACTYDTTRAAHGTMSAKLTPTSGAACNIKYGAQSGGSMLASTSPAARVYAYFTANPSSEYTFLRADDASNAIRFRINISAAGKLIVSTNDGTSTTTRWTSTQSVPLNQWVRIEIRAVIAAGTGGSIECAFYVGDSTSPVDSFTVSGINTGANAVQSIQFGKYGSDTTATAFWLDEIAVNTSTSSFIGPVANAVPVVSAGPDQSVAAPPPPAGAAAATVTLNGSASDVDGSIASVAWAYVGGASTGSPALSNSGVLNPTFVAGSAPQLYTLDLTVTDDDGATATDRVEIRVPLTGSTPARPLPFAAGKSGTWNRTGGTSDGGALSDDSDATYLESGDVSATQQVLRFRLAPHNTLASAAVELMLSSDTGTTNWQVRLYQGGGATVGAGTLRQSWTQNAVPATPTDYEFVLSSGTISALASDWGELWIEAGVTS
jgi:hypothetical protein